MAVGPATAWGRPYIGNETPTPRQEHVGVARTVNTTRALQILGRPHNRQPLY